MRRGNTTDKFQTVDQDQESAGLLSNLPSDWYKTEDPELCTPEILPAASTFDQLLLPGHDPFSVVQEFDSTPFDTSPFQSTSIEVGTRLSCDDSPNSPGTKNSPESPESPLSSQNPSDRILELDENFAAADQFSNSEARRPEILPRRRKPGGLSSNHAEPMRCPKCPKTFVRRCELS